MLLMLISPLALLSGNLEISMVERIGWQASPPANALPIRLLLSIP
jgi:hypothetical protein